MCRLWSFLGSKKDREIVGWLGGGIVIVIAGLSMAFVYFPPAKGDGREGKGGVSASYGTVSVGRKLSNSTVRSKLKEVGNSQPQGC